MDEILVGSFIPAGAVPSKNLANVWKPIHNGWYPDALYGGVADSGVRVNQETAITHTPIWHGLTLLGGDAGSLPIEIKRRDGERTTNVTDHPAYQLAAVQPNPIMCPAAFWEVMVVISILHGNSIAKIERNNSGRALTVREGGGLSILHPLRTEPWFDKTGKLWIQTWNQREAGLPQYEYIDPDDCFHIPSLTMDGYWGRGIIQVGRNRIGNGLGMEKQVNRFMRNGMTPSWLFSYPMALDPEDAIAIEERLQRANAGLENSGRNIVLDHDVKAEQLGMTFESAQFVELQKMDIRQVASLLGIPAVMLNSMDAMTFSNAEESERWYINRTLRRWLYRITQEIGAKLLSDRERENMFAKHDLSPLLMGRLLERMQAYSQGIASRIFSPNEIREKEGLNPYEGGDAFENPNTSSSPLSGADQSTTATKLKPVLKFEDYELSEACRREGNVIDWSSDFYSKEMLNRMLEIVPKSAGQYCEGRSKLWMKTSNHVFDKIRLGEIVKAQAQTQSDRLAGILNAEFAA